MRGRIFGRCRGHRKSYHKVKESNRGSPGKVSLRTGKGTGSRVSGVEWDEYVDTRSVSLRFFVTTPGRVSVERRRVIRQRGRTVREERKKGVLRRLS